MKRLLLCVILSLCYAAMLKAQTVVTVIGSVHSPTKYITGDTLLKALTRFKADIVLLELDSSLMDDKGSFKRDPKKMSLESETVQRYKDLHPDVRLGRIDVIYRNKYYTDNNTFAKEGLMGKVIDSLYKSNSLNDTTWFIVNSLYSATQILNNFGYMQLKDINSAGYMDVASFRQDLLYRREVTVIANNPDLKNWYPFAKENAGFWDLRNHTMVNNTLAFVKRYPGKRIAVIVGSYHKYALVGGLKKIAAQNHFVLFDNLF